jgi:hypothetical protein
MCPYPLTCKVQAAVKAEQTSAAMLAAAKQGAHYTHQLAWTNAHASAHAHGALQPHLLACSSHCRLPLGNECQRCPAGGAFVVGWQGPHKLLLHGGDLSKECLQHGLDLVPEGVLAALQAHRSVIKPNLQSLVAEQQQCQ